MLAKTQQKSEYEKECVLTNRQNQLTNDIL